MENISKSKQCKLRKARAKLLAAQKDSGKISNPKEFVEKEEHEALRRKLELALSENEKLLSQNKDLKRQRGCDALRNMIVLGKIQQERRARGANSDEEGDLEFVRGGSDFPGSTASDDSFGSSDRGNEESESSELDSEVASDVSSETSPIVIEMEKQMKAFESLLQIDSFAGKAAPATVEKAQCLHSRAADACAFLAEHFDENAVLSWVQVLQRNLGTIVHGNLRHISETILQTASVVKKFEDEEVVCLEYTHPIWKALSWEDRHRILTEFN